MSDPVAMGFRGAARPLQPGDIQAAASRLGCRAVALQAVLEVEAGGRAFDSRGRPVVEFEPHVFWRNLPSSLRSRAQAEGLAWPAWRPGHYPGTSDGMYDQIARACAIDEDAALKATSWGIGQTLGEEHEAAGYSDVRALVLDAMESAAAQLAMMASEIMHDGLAPALAGENWAAFARGYNGPGYAANHYDTKLAAYVGTYQAPAAPAASTTPVAEPPATPVAGTSAPSSGWPDGMPPGNG